MQYACSILASVSISYPQFSLSRHWYKYILYVHVLYRYLQHCSIAGTLFTHLAQFSGELEAVFISHVGEQEGVDGTSLGGVPLTRQGEQLLLPLCLLELVVHCKATYNVH